MQAAQRVVVADNDVGARDLVVTDLRLEGHQVVATAADGDSAVAACLEHRPDVLVIDYRMPPGPDGLETARQVKVHLPDVRVVVFSNRADDDIIRRGRRLGVRYLQKGDLRSLRRAVQSQAGRT